MIDLLKLLLYAVLVPYCFLCYAPYFKKQAPPEGTPRWIFWLNRVFIIGMLAAVAMGFPFETLGVCDPDFIQKWDEFVLKWLNIVFPVCLLGRTAIYYYYKFRHKFKK